MSNVSVRELLLHFNFDAGSVDFR